jgi:polar amino acid transport system substrate-binding protein
MVSGIQTVRFAHDLGFPPFAERIATGSAGMIVDMLRACGTRAGFLTEFVAVPFDEVQKTMKDGRADAIFPLGINPERREIFNFSEPLFVTGAALFTRRSDPYPSWPSFDDLIGKIVTTPRTGPLVDYIVSRFPKVTLIPSDDYDQSLAQLMRGDADAAALNLQVGATMVVRHWSDLIRTPQGSFLDLPLAVAVLRGRNEWLIARLNETLASMRADGTLSEIVVRWGRGLVMKTIEDRV